MDEIGLLQWAIEQGRFSLEIDYDRSIKIYNKENDLIIQNQHINKGLLELYNNNKTNRNSPNICLKKRLLWAKSNGIAAAQLDDGNGLCTKGSTKIKGHSLYNALVNAKRLELDKG